MTDITSKMPENRQIGVTCNFIPDPANVKAKLILSAQIHLQKEDLKIDNLVLIQLQINMSHVAL